ncbi:hypothetical protein [Zavarzinia sp.]|uniref:hypothetical protein n=1 Tax=Zavarzinia sp. TaxID=2027920 RepID=UPI003568603D
MDIYDAGNVVSYRFRRRDRVYLVSVSPAPPTGGMVYRDEERLNYVLVTLLFPGIGAKVLEFKGRGYPVFNREETIFPSYVFWVNDISAESVPYISEKLGVDKTTAGLVASAMRHYAKLQLSRRRIGAERIGAV